MRHALLCLCLCACALAGESSAVQEFRKAMAGDDGAAKRDAVRRLAGKDAGEDADIIPLLIGAVGDRQASAWAIQSLQARTGLSKPARGRGGVGYPGYPVSNDAAGWSAWFEAWKKDAETRGKIDQLTKAAPAPGAPLPGGDAAAAGTAAPPKPVDAPEPAPRHAIDDLGKLDRIVYKSGRTLVAYVRAKRLDGDGNLVSLRVVHRDGVGEEVVDAAVVARIEEDIE